MQHADRVFEQGGRPFVSDQPGKMSYEDFVCLLISEEDKTSEASLRYWFNVVDTNGDGILTPDEMRHFYREQHARMVELGLEAVAFDDLLTQMTDLLDPGALVRFFTPYAVDFVSFVFVLSCLLLHARGRQSSFSTP